MTDDFDSRLGVLRNRFLDRARMESEVLDAIAGDIDGGGAGAKVGPLIRGIAHRLAGAGGTFGFAAISLCAAELQDFVSAVPDSPDIADACRALADEIRRAA